MELQTSHFRITSGQPADGQSKFFSIPETFTVIGFGTYDSNGVLTKINIPGSVTEIEDRAFKYCGFLENAEIGGRTESIGSDAFQYCKLLTRIDIPAGVGGIDGAAFKYAPESPTIHGEKTPMQNSMHSRKRYDLLQTIKSKVYGLI